ncbi:MAG: hypothetical protein LQ340_005851, partial [Diploschistes diacapsis]
MQETAPRPEKLLESASERNATSASKPSPGDTSLRPDSIPKSSGEKACADDPETVPAELEARTIERLKGWRLHGTTFAIVFRAFQGIGGSGLLSLTFVIFPEMVEPEKYALYASFTVLAFVLGFLFGPIFGGAIVGYSTWRWVFLLNLPAGLVTLVLVFIFIPVGFPDLRATTALVHLGMLGEIDYIGASLVFATSAFLVSALEEGGTAYAWSSSAIVVLLVLEIKWTTKQPIFTLRLMKNRVFMGALLYEILWLSGEYTLTLRRITFLTGATFTVAVIQIPQEWQTVSNCTALEAGTRLLPFTIFYSVGTILAMILTSKLHVPPVFVILLGAALQIISVAVMSCIPVRTGAAKYICEIILGIGVGTNIGVLVQLTPQLIRGKDQATAMGAITQFRALGGVIGLASVTNVFNDYVRSQLSRQLTPDQLTSLLQSAITAIAQLPPESQNAVKSTFAVAYDLQTKVLIGFAVAQALA